MIGLLARLYKAWMAPACPSCGRAGVVTEYVVHTTLPYGVGEDMVELSLDMLVLRCGACSEEFVDHRGEEQRERCVQDYLARKSARGERG